MVSSRVLCDWRISFLQYSTSTIRDEFGWYYWEIQVLCWFFLAQAAIDASGLSFNGYMENEKREQFEKFDRVSTIEINLEISDNPKYIVDNWNKSVQVWLRKYVYLRQANESELKNNKKMANKAALRTFIFSAFWHGFYVSYYISFLIAYLLLQNAKYIYKAGWKFRKYPEYVLYPLRYILTFTFINFMAIGFMVLQFQKTVQWYKQMWYMPAILLLTYAFFKITKWGQKRPLNSRRDIVDIKDETQEYLIEKRMEEEMRSKGMKFY